MLDLAAFFTSRYGWRFRNMRIMETKLYVGNLSYNTTDNDLRTLFAQAGTVTSVDLIKDRDTGMSKGFGFVQMSTQAEAEQAIKMFNGYDLDNRQLKVNPARPKEESGSRSYGNSSSGGYGRDQRQGNRNQKKGQRRY
jgi:cold-inducible RNA-binding protein